MEEGSLNACANNPESSCSNPVSLLALARVPLGDVLTEQVTGYTNAKISQHLGGERIRLEVKVVESQHILLGIFYTASLIMCDVLNRFYYNLKIIY